MVAVVVKENRHDTSMLTDYYTVSVYLGGPG